jgi:hypothetical protein
MQLVFRTLHLQRKKVEVLLKAIQVMMNTIERKTLKTSYSLFAIPTSHLFG